MKIDKQATSETETIDDIPKSGTVFSVGDDFFISDYEDRYINLETGVVTAFHTMDVITILPEATLIPYGSSVKEILKDLANQSTVPISTKTLNDTIDMLEGLRMQIENPKNKYSPQAIRSRLNTLDDLIGRLAMTLNEDV